MTTLTAHFRRWQTELSPVVQLRLRLARDELLRFWAGLQNRMKHADVQRGLKQYFGVMLITLGVLLSSYVVGTYAWILREQHVLHQEWQAENASAVSSAKSALTRLFIPKIQLDAVISEGTSHKALTLGPGHLKQTALPGESGNSVIAAHRDTFFRHISELRLGDDIYVQRRGQQFHYVVTDKRVVQPSDLSVLRATTDSQLTLITCYPTYFIGPAPERLVIFARLLPESI